jgi:hypothetical protein
MPQESKITAELADELVTMYTRPHNPATRSDLVQHCARQGVKVGIRTISTILAQRQARRLNKPVDTPELRLRIASLFFQECLPDQAIHEVLVEDGYRIAYRTFVQFRRAIGIKRKHSAAEYEARYKEFKAIVSKELDKGEISSYGRTMLHTYFRIEPSLQMLISRYVN